LIYLDVKKMAKSELFLFQRKEIKNNEWASSGTRSNIITLVQCSAQAN